MNKLTMALLPAMFALNQAHAEEQEAAVDLWKASAEVGYVATSGNTNTETLNLKAMAATDREEWRHKIEMSALNASDNDVATAEKYSAEAQSDYKFVKPNYLFGNLRYENDKFSGYQYQVTEVIGYGRRVVDKTDLTLDLEIGPGARQTKRDDGTTDSEGMIRGAAKLHWAISSNSKFGEVLIVDAGEDVTVTKSVTSLSSKINGSLSMKVTYTIKKTSEVPLGIDDTDTETAITLVYDF